ATRRRGLATRGARTRRGGAHRDDRGDDLRYPCASSSSFQDYLDSTRYIVSVTLSTQVLDDRPRRAGRRVAEPNRPDVVRSPRRDPFEPVPLRIRIVARHDRPTDPVVALDQGLGTVPVRRTPHGPHLPGRRRRDRG